MVGGGEPIFTENMSVSAVSGGSSRVDQDPQVQTLQSKIKDWQDCKTTDPQVKKQIVAKLEVQLDSVKSSLEASEKSKVEQAESSGVGARLDLSA